MERCILCGRDYESGERCPVCGFEREKHIFNDIRDAKDGDPLRLDEGTREALDKRNKIMLSYILSIDASSAPQEQVDSTVTEALRQLSIPTYVPLGKELSMNESERALLMAIGDKMDELDLARGGVCGRCETYVRLANGEYSIKEVDRALTHLDRAILKDPRSPDAIYNKGRILFYEKKYAESIRMLEKLVKLEPARDDVRYFLELVNQMKA